MGKNALAIDLSSTFSAKQEPQESQLFFLLRMYWYLILNSTNKVKKCCIETKTKFSCSDIASK